MCKHLFGSLVTIFILTLLLLFPQTIAQAVMGPDLTITKSHTGNFTVGTNGTYTILVSNVGGADSSGTITVTDTLPTGLTFISATGSGWTCSASNGTVTCTNPGPLIASVGSSTITLVVKTGGPAVPSVTNTATVSGGGDVNPDNNSSSDPTTVVQTARSGPSVYISSFTGSQILAVDGETGATVVLFNFTPSDAIPFFTPEDVVVGPDARIYIGDSDNSRIRRVRQDGTQMEIIYDAATATSPNNPTGPEGPSFQGNDLYFNTRNLDGEASTHTGVWKIAGITTVPFGGSPPGTFPAPSQVFTKTDTGSTFGEGTAFDSSGNLYIVDRSNSRVLKSSPPYTPPPSVFIPRQTCVDDTCTTNLDTPFGIAVRSSNGHVFVASDGSLLKNVNEFDSSGGLVGTYVTFADDNTSEGPVYLEVDAFGRLYIVTNTSGAATGAKIWRVDPPGGIANRTLLADFTALANSSIIATNKAVGVGVSLNTFITHTFSPAVTSNLYDFGTDKVTVHFLGTLLDTFDLVLFREEMSPSLVAQQVTANFSGDPCAQYNLETGACVVYEALGADGTAPPPVAGTDFTVPPTGPAIDIQFFYSSTESIFTPVVAHALENNVQTPVDQYDENILTAFTAFTAVPDPGMDTGSGGLSRYVILNKPLPPGFENSSFCGFQAPIPPGRIFNKPQTIAVKFQATTGPNCTGAFITDATAHLSLFKVNPNGGFEPVKSSGGSNTGDLFRFDLFTNSYIYNLSTKDLPTPGTYIITAWSDRFPAAATFFLLQ